MVASKACSSACSALLRCTVGLSTLPIKLSSPFWLVGSVALGGVNGAGGTCQGVNDFLALRSLQRLTGGKRYLLVKGKHIIMTPKIAIAMTA